MEQHFTLTDREFEQQFAQAILPPALFTHEAHLRLAWIHIRQYGMNQAIENICNQLINYTNHLDARDKYNATLTIAAVKVVHHFMNKQHIDTFSDFITTYPRLKNNFKEIIAQHYSIDIFTSAEAKSKFLEPDLLEFL